MKNTYYFSHDYNATSDIKLQTLIMKMGYEGLGFYWHIVEMLYQAGGKIELSQCESIAFAMRTDSGKIKQLIELVFEKDNDYFWSETVLVRIKLQKEKSQLAKKSAQKRWKNEAKNDSNGKDANAMPTHSERNAIKESKVNKIKEIKVNNKNKELSLFLEKFNLLFDKKYLETEGRKDKLKARLKTYTLEQIIQATTNLSRSAFHRGKNDRNWVADPDFLIKNDEQIDKWLNSAKPTPKQQDKSMGLPASIKAINNMPAPTPEELARAEKIKAQMREKWGSKHAIT